MPPIQPSTPRPGAKAFGRMIGRSLDFLGVGIVAVLALCPIVAFAWVVLRLGGLEAGELPRRIAIGIGAVAAVSGVVLLRVTRSNLRSIRNVSRPRGITLRQVRIREGVFYRAGQACVVVGLAAIALAVPAHVY
jgi:hypothetical protein